MHPPDNHEEEDEPAALLTGFLENKTQRYRAMVTRMEKDLIDIESNAVVAWCASSLAEHEALAVDTSRADPIPLPRSAHEALTGPWKKEWRAAMIEDLEGKARNGMSASIDRDPTEPVMKGKWVFLVKYNSDHSVKKFRARWVAKGYSQVEGVHYHETFSSTMRNTSTRYLLASSIGVCKKTGERIKRRHIDVDKAFTHSKMDCRVIMEKPHGFEVPGKVDLLIKALEGTKQAGHLWQQLNSSKMRDFGLRQSVVDPCLFYMEEGDAWLRIGVFVDDILAVFNSDALFDKFFKFYQKSEPQIKCHEEGDVEKFTGFEVTTTLNNDKITLHQKAYIENVYRRFCDGENNKLWGSPVGSTRDELEKFMNQKGAQTESDRNLMAGKDYLGLIGCLLYAACQTRPDTQYYVSHLAQFMQDPSPANYNAGIGVLCYLYRTRSLGITYDTDTKECPATIQAGGEAVDTELLKENDGLMAFSDASFARDSDLASVNGFVVMYRNGAISWMSKKLKVVCQSTTEAETAGASIACKDVNYVRSLMTDTGLPPRGPTPLLIDSSGTYGFVRHQSAKQRTKYFELWVSYVREAYRSSRISPHLVTTKTEVADVFTKALPKGELQAFRNYMLNCVEHI
jgi:hypothetical protein